MHGLGGWASAGVEVESLALLHRVKDQVQIPVGKEDSSPKKVMNWNEKHIKLNSAQQKGLK